MTSNPIADLSYRNYDGPLESPRYRWWAIARSGMLIAFKKKSMWVFTVMSAWYYIAMIFILFIIDQISAGVPPGQPDPSQVFFGRIIWKDQFLHGFQYGQILYFVVALILGAGAIANDSRANALLVYLSKPITKRDYIFGKWFGIFLPLLMVMMIPSMVFFLYGLLSFRDKGFLLQDPWLIVKIFTVMPVSAALHASLVLGISSLFKQGRMAGSVYAAVYFLTNFFTVMMGMAAAGIAGAFSGQGADVSKVPPVVVDLYYASVDGLSNGFMKSVLKTSGGVPFGLPSPGRGAFFIPYPPLWLSVLTMLGVSALCIFVAWRRVRAVDIVGG